MRPLPGILQRYVEAITASKLTIYDPITIGDPQLWIPSPELEAILDTRLAGLSLEGLALRTRSKALKGAVCSALGYPVPKSFKKTKPRFPGQNFDTYGQKANNLQIWNDELAPARRYVITRISEDCAVECVRVVSGDTLAKLDTTGTLTQKYQARLSLGNSIVELVTSNDTDNLSRHLAVEKLPARLSGSPTDQPTPSTLLPISDVFNRLRPLVGERIVDAGIDQERNRGAELHQLVCKALGYSDHADNGQFPDVRHQLLEVKLQTSPTIDLGLVRPDSQDVIDVPMLSGRQVLHCDVRYVIFVGQTDGRTVKLTHLILTTGQEFFSRFTQFQGKVLNRKLQIPLPAPFFER